jgi:hypothetical protein
MGEWRVKYDGVCARCGIALPKGTPAVWDRASRTIRCIECPAPEPTPPPVATAIDVGVAGRSAREKHDRLEARRDAAISERWGTGRVARIVRAFSGEPQSTRAWAIGAAGEEKLAAELDRVPGLRMLHDRRVPGTQGNIDHIVIGPAGVFVVDAKNNHGAIAIQDRGGWFRTDLRLTIAGRDRSTMADHMGWQVSAVEAALERAGIEPLPPVTPVLCFLNVEWPLLRSLDQFRGVRLESHRSIRRLVTSPTSLSEEEADRLVRALAQELPAK